MLPSVGERVVWVDFLNANRCHGWKVESSTKLWHAEDAEAVTGSVCKKQQLRTGAKMLLF